MTELFIEFDSSQLTIATDVDAIAQFTRETYRHMLADRVTSSVGRIEVCHTAEGFVLRSLETLELPEQSCDPLFPFLKEEIILRFMRKRPDLLWIHAGAVTRNGSSILLSGRSGQGKSTFTTMLLNHGWSLMSDDVAPICMSTGEVLPFYQSPSRRIDPGKEVSPEDLGSVQREAVDVPSDSIQRDRALLKAVVFPVFKRSAPVTFTRMRQGAGALELLRNTRNFSDHGAAAVERAASFARNLPMFQLCYGSAADALSILNTIL
jgi:hypothetical protein